MKTAMTIGLNGSMLDTQPTGVGVYSYNVINMLSRLYHQEGKYNVVVYAPTTQFLEIDSLVKPTSQFLQSSKYGKLAAVFRFFWNNLILPYYSLSNDFIFNPTSHGSLFIGNQITTVHDLLSLRYGYISFHQRLYFRYVLPGLLKRSRLIITVSQSSKNDIVSLLGCAPEKIRVIYNGYDNKKYSLADAEIKPIGEKYQLSNYLLAVGPTYPHKNFERLLEAYSQLPESLRQQHQLVILGGFKKYIKKLKQLCSELHISSQVKFMGYVPAEELPQFYREAIGLVYPSLSEGFGFPLLEAMACGCPVTCSRTSSMPEVCGEAALYFDPESSQSICLAIQKIIGEPELRKSLRQQGLIQCQQFSWEKTACSLKQLIDQELHSN